ncbi:MAG: hypothetical protein LBD99_05555 [Candidatus Margulisbacteria bacterium]|jgi:hypothetical protein|nr:hypothetical protein [Candidatus Margulisiibacteriota bacterium]
MDLDTIKVTAFNEKVQTPFLAMRSDKIDELREKITVKANLQKLLTMVTQAKGDSYNAILQILTQQSGYQKMNLEKLNDKQLESLNNYINTRTKEIATFVNKHNETEKAKIEKELAERKEREYGNIFLKLAAGLISLVVSIIAAIFSAGIAAPVVVSVIAACVDIVATARQTQSDIEIKKEQEKIEEYLALLRATEQKYATETLRRKKEELEKLQNEAEANSEYYQLLDLEIMQLNATLQNTALSYSNGWLKFDNSNYLQNVLRVQALINAMRLYAVLQKEEHEGRNRVAAELSLPGAYSGRGGDTIVNSRATVLLEKMNKLGELEIQMAEAYNRRKAVSEEIKQNRLRMGLDILGKAAFSFINLVTFGTGGTALAGALSGAGEAAYGMVSKYLLLINTSYNPTAPADFRAPNPSQEQFESLYSDLLAQSSELSRNLTANKKTLDYDKYLKLLKDIETRQIKEHLLSSISEAEKNSRGVIHQEMTDNKGRAQDAFVKIAGQQNITLLQDIAQKQAYLTKIQSQTINQQVDQRTEIANAGFNILLSAGAGFLSGQAQLAGTDKKTTDAFLYGLGSGLLSNSGKDIFDLLIGDSDLKLQTEDQQYSSSNFLSSGSFENMLAGDKNGNYTVSQNALLRNYAKLQRQILVEQALVSIHSAKQKARNIIHMELAEKSAPPAENAKAIAGYRQEGLLNRWNIFTEQAYTAAEQLSTKENRWTDLQRNFLINITSAALGGAAFAGGLTAEQSTGLQKLTYLSLQTITQLHALQDTSLDIANKVSAEHFSAGELTETLGFNRLAEAEAALFNEALELKASSGKYGFQVENKAWLEYLNMLLERLQKIKEITLRLNAAVRDSRSNVHSILDAAAVDSDSLIDDAIKLQSQFLRQTMQAIKQGDSEIVKRRNQRNSKKFELYLGLFSGAFQAFEALIPFFSESTTKEAMTLLAQDFQSFLPLLQAGFLQLNRGEHRAPELPDLSGLTKAERASVLSAQATAELALTNTPFQLWQKTIDLTEQGIRSLDKMAARKMTADIMEQRLEQLLAENRLQEARTKIESLASQQETRRRNIAEFFARLETNEYYASHILPAYELYQTGRSAEALAKLQEKCTENFLQGVNLSEQEIADIRALQDNLTSLLDADAGLSAARAELQALEADARVAGREFAQSLEYIRAHLGSNNEAQKIYFDLSADKDLLAAYQSDLSARFSEEKYYTVLHRYVLAGDAETENLENGLEAKTVEFMRAMRAYVQEYRGMLNAVLQVAPLFNSNEAAYKSLLEELALTAAFYGGEASLTFSALTKAQTWYGFTLKIYDGFISDYDFSFTAPALEQIALAQGKELTLNDWEYYVCISAIFRDSNFTLPAGVTSPEDIKAFANRQVDIAGQASNINASHSYTAPEADLGNLWAQYFIEHGQTQEKRDNLEKKQAALAAARNDLAAVERLFEVNGLTAEIDIAEAGLSGGALDYLQSLYGRGKIRFSQAMRDRVLEYLTRKKNNLEIDLLNSEADLDFAENLLDNDWANIQQKQTEYEDKLRRLAADGQEPTGEQIAELTRAREELERLERDYQRKRRSFLEQRRRGIIN